MLKIQDLMDNREISLDLLCFPHLFFFFFCINGQREARQIKLHDHEFIKLRLTSKHSQYRSDIDYLLFLLNNANIR